MALIRNYTRLVGLESETRFQLEDPRPGRGGRRSLGLLE